MEITDTVQIKDKNKEQSNLFKLVATGGAILVTLLCFIATCVYLCKSCKSPKKVSNKVKPIVIEVSDKSESEKRYASGEIKVIAGHLRSES